MRITAVEVYGVQLVQSATSAISGGRTIASQDSTIVALRTDEGITGWGESAPWSPTYLPTSAGAIRASLELIAPAILGLDATSPNAIGAAMESAVRGQEQAKSAVDVACWDALGKSLGVPVHSLLGGRVTEWLPYAGFLRSEDGLAAMVAAMGTHRSAGRPHFEFKATGDAARDAALVAAVTAAMEPHELLKVDANGGWSVADAVEVMAAARGRVLYEQPCATYEHCVALRRRSTAAISLDEVVVTMPDLVGSITDGVADVHNLKIARVGGLSMAKAMRDVCVAYGVPLIVQCVGGSELATAAIAHLASTVPPQLLMSVWDGTAMLTTRCGDGHETNGNAMRASDEPGLGIVPRADVLGPALFTVR